MSIQHILTPRFILQQVAAGKQNGRLQAATLFVDISGFTAVTEALMQHGKVGAEALADVMQAIFTPLITAVYERGGFIAGFAGDAFTAIFPGSGKRAKAQAVTAAWQMRQALAAFADHSTSFGTFSFTGRVGVAAGPVNWGILAGGAQRTAYFRGRAVDLCAEAEHQAVDGEVVLATDVAEALADFLTTTAKADASFVRLDGVAEWLSPGKPVRFDEVVMVETAVAFHPESLLNMPVKGEFRQVVSVFINLGGNPRPAALSQFMTRCFALLAQYGGYLCRLDFGDKGCNLLLFWGAPTSHENDIERALNFLLALQADVRLPLRAGVTYRQAFAGFAGAPLREEYTCYGLSINQSARQMMAAPWGQLWLDGETARRAVSFEITSVGSFPFKGFATAQPVFQLMGRREADVPFYRGLFAGREMEMAQIRGMLDSLQNGRFAGVLLISGEAGIGKSRLVHEFTRSKGQSSILNPQSSVLNPHPSSLIPQFFICQTDEILRRPLNPFRYWLRRYFNQSEAQDDAANKDAFFLKLAGLIAATADADLQAEMERTESFLGALVDLFWPDSLYGQLEPALRFENTVTALKTLLRAESWRQPAFLVVEDGQWLDEESRQFLRQLPRNMDDFPLAVLLTSREAAVGELFDTETAVTHIALMGLNEQTVVEVAYELLGGVPSPELVALLQARAEGNPFFLEQIVLYLQEQGMVQETEGGFSITAENKLLPQDVQAVLVARLDRLTQAVRNVVQTAAVLGREFEVRVLSHMLQNESGVQERVAEAEKAAVWIPLSEIRYLFRHALLRDAAYQMQLQTRLRALHQLAAQTLEQLFIEEKRPYLSDLVFHFRQAGMDDKERHYARLLGDEAADQYANGDAISAYSRALELAHDDPVEQAKMLLARAKIYKLVGNREAQEADMAQLMTLLTAVDDSQLQHDIWLEQASFAELRGDYHQAAKIANQLLETVPIRQYPRTVTLAHHQLGRSLIDIAEHEKAKKVLFETLTLAQRYGFQSEEASALLHLGHAFDDQKLFHDAIRYYEQALPIFADLNDKRGQCVLYNNLGVAAAVVADMATTLRYYEQALTIANEIGFRRGQLVIAGNVANQKARQGKYGEALANMLQSVTLSRELGSPRDESRFLNNIGYLYVELGLYDESLSYFQQSLDIRQRIGVRRSVGSSLLNLALWALRQERYEEARQYAQRGFEVSHEIEDKNGEVQATMFLGRALAGLGRLTEAETTFQTTLAGAHDLNQTEGGAMIEALCGLADLFWARGERSVALAHVAQILEMLAKHVPEDLINPRRIRWHCYQMLRVVDAEAAAELLDALVMELQQFAEQIPDTVMRHSFLTNVLMNRAILEEARSVISSRR